MGWWAPFTIVELNGLEYAHGWKKYVYAFGGLAINLAWTMFMFGSIAFAIGIGLRLAL